MSAYKPNSILHAFDPNLYKHHHHDEVYFVEGRYLDIASSKGKDPHTLYFGTSNVSPLLTGIFLGDVELTSRVKDIQLVPSKDGVSYDLIVKYINDKNKLATVKTTLLGQDATKDIIDAINNIKQFIDTINSSINDIYDKLNIIDSSIDAIDEHLNIIDSSINTLVDELETGKYNYTVRGSIAPLSDGCKKIFTLFKGDEEQIDSSSIEITDYALKSLEYIEEDNQLVALTWPDACGDELELTVITGTNYDGTPVVQKVGKIPDEFIKKVTLDLNPFEEHLINKINTDSPVNDRLVFVEDQLKWESLFQGIIKK